MERRIIDTLNALFRNDNLRTNFRCTERMDEEGRFESIIVGTKANTQRCIPDDVLLIVGFDKARHLTRGRSRKASIIIDARLNLDSVLNYQLPQAAKGL